MWKIKVIISKLSDKLKRKLDECEKLKEEYDELVNEIFLTDPKCAEFSDKQNKIFSKHVKLRKKLGKYESDKGACVKTYYESLNV